MGAELGKIIPELWLASLVLLLVPLSTLLPQGRKGPVTWFAIGGLLTSLLPALPLLGQPGQPAFGGTYAVDSFSTFFKFVCVAASVIVLLMTLETFHGRRAEGEVPVMVVLATLGMELLAGSNDLALIALTLQLVSVPSYIMVGMLKEEPRSGEAALKFFLFSATASAVMLYGMSFLYGLSGSLNLAELGRKLPGADFSLVVVGLALLLVGYGFKITIFPFHAWAPDTYQGSATPIAAFLSIGPKAAALAVLVRTLVVAFPGDLAGWPTIIAVSAALTMTFGNLVALRQRDLKRLLAYSSIAQAGYLLMGVAAAKRDSLAIQGLLFYLLAYLFMNLGAFAVVTAVERLSGSVDLQAYRGLARRQPFLALSLTLCLLSLAGLPPLAGFVGKTILFGAAIGAGFSWLAVVAALNTAISLYYYVKIIAPMYLQPPLPPLEGEGSFSAKPKSRPFKQAVSPVLLAAIIITAAGTLLAGIFPEPLLALVKLGVGLL